MATGSRLAIGATIVAGVTVYMACLGASSSWQYYLTVDECLAKVPALVDDRVRISGNVAAESLRIAPDRRGATFQLQGSIGHLPVSCEGPIPDNLAENRAVVVEGRLQADGSLKGDKVLTRCASKYSSEAPGEQVVASRPEVE